MIMRRNVLLAAIILLLSHCTATELIDFDEETWKKDRSGCQSLRIPLKTALDHNKEKLLKLQQEEVISLLGKPDRQELDSRNKKLFIYFLEPGDDCANAQSGPLQLHIRFSALGISYEVAYKNL